MIVKTRVALDETETIHHVNPDLLSIAIAILLFSIAEDVMLSSYAWTPI